MSNPLRYKIRSWDQLPQCLSVTSDELHARVATLMQNDKLTGTKISIFSDTLGELFTCVADSRGYYKYNTDELTTAGILSVLESYGFLVEFRRRANLPQPQLDYLRSLLSLRFDKIRLVSVKDIHDHAETTIVAFQSDANYKWLSNMYNPKREEFINSVSRGTAVNLFDSSFRQGFNWDWLDYVANIQDILDDNELGDSVD